MRPELHILLIVLAAAGSAPIVALTPPLGAEILATEHRQVEDVSRPVEWPATRLAVRSIVGPYWATGPFVEEARALMVSLGERGPVVVRYLDDPLATSPDRLRVEVGFAMSEEAPLPQSYAIVDQGPQMVLRKSIETGGRFGSRAYLALRSDASRQGLRPVGPVWEWIDVATDGTNVRQGRVEVLMPVCEPDTEAAPSESMGALDETQEVPETLAIDASDEQEVEAEAIDPAGGQGEAYPSDPHANALDTADDRAAADHVDSAVADVLTDRELPVPLPDLIRDGLFSEAAGRLLPDNVNLNYRSDRVRAWENQFVLRVAGLARGMEKLHPTDAGWITGLAKALIVRAEELSRSASQMPIAFARSNVDSESEDRWTQRREVIRKLDMLMGRLAVKSHPPNEILEFALELLVEIAEIVRDQ